MYYVYVCEGNVYVVFCYIGLCFEFCGVLLCLLKIFVGVCGDCVWWCYIVDVLVWGVDCDEVLWMMFDVAARDAFFANASTTSGRVGWWDDWVVVCVDGDVLNVLVLKMMCDVVYEMVRVEGCDGCVVNAAEVFG